MEIHGEGKGAKTTATEEGDTGTKVSRADGFEPPVQDTVWWKNQFFCETPNKSMTSMVYTLHWSWPLVLGGAIIVWWGVETGDMWYMVGWSGLKSWDPADVSPDFYTKGGIFVRSYETL